LTVTIDVAYASGKFSATFTGDLVLTTSAGKELEFDVTFSTNNDDTWITAEYKGAALELADLADAIDFPLPHDIPSDLDLGLSAVGFFYDFTGGGLVVGAKSDNYGLATLATLPLSGKRQFFFILDTGKEFSLSNLPLVGHELAQIENVSISKLKAIIATTTVDGTQAKTVDDEIA